MADIKKKFVARIWALQHLGRMGMGQRDLVAVYKSTILPIHDYCSTVYNSSLTITQSGQLETLQAMALKAIFGYEHSYRALLSLSTEGQKGQTRGQVCGEVIDQPPFWQVVPKACRNQETSGVRPGAGKDEEIVQLPALPSEKTAERENRHQQQEHTAAKLVEH